MAGSMLDETHYVYCVNITFGNHCNSNIRNGAQRINFITFDTLRH